MNPLERSDEDIEINFFKRNFSLGEYINWIIVGDLIDPDWLSEDTRKVLAIHLSEWQLDDLPQRMKSLRDLLYSNGSLPRVIYTHCEAGTDRTGEMSGAYYLRYLNMTLEEAVYIDNHVQSRPMYQVSLRGLKWYCYYLKYTTNSTLTCTISNAMV